MVMSINLYLKYKNSTVSSRTFLLFCTGLFVLFGCGIRKQTDKKIFRYNEVSGIATLDPAFAKNQSVMWPIHQIYNTLVEVDEEMNIRPSLAKSWNFSDDKKQIDFIIRDDAYFHDDPAFSLQKGRKLVAKDIEYSLNRIIDKRTASPGAWIFNERVDSIKPFEAINDTVFRIKLLKPFHPILGILSMQYCSIVAKEAVEHYGQFYRSHPVGTGPFAFVAWDEGQALILKKNPHYFEVDSIGERLPYLDGIKVSFYDSRATEFLEFQQARLDFLNDVDPSFKDEILTKTGNLKKEWQGQLQLNKHPYLNIEYLGILVDSTNPLVKNSPLKIKKIRQAINYAIDRKKMILYLRNSIGTAAESGFIPQGLPSFDKEKVVGYPYNLQIAKSLLLEAGIQKSSDLPTIKLLTIPNYANLGSYIANELLQAGIPVQVEVVQKSLLLEQTSKSEALFFRGSWIADYPDAENFLSVFYGDNPAPPNYTRYKNKAFDNLYNQAINETVDSVRYTLYQKMDQMILNDAVVIPLWYDMVLHLVHNDIKGFKPNSLNMLELRRVKKI